MKTFPSMVWRKHRARPVCGSSEKSLKLNTLVSVYFAIVMEVDNIAWGYSDSVHQCVHCTELQVCLYGSWQLNTAECSEQTSGTTGRGRSPDPTSPQHRVYNWLLWCPTAQHQVQVGLCISPNQWGAGSHPSSYVDVLFPVVSHRVFAHISFKWITTTNTCGGFVNNTEIVVTI